MSASGGCDAILVGYRSSIDNIDAALVRLMAERFRITLTVGKYKAEHGLPAAAPYREAIQIARLRTLAGEAGLGADFTVSFLRFVINEVIRHHRWIERAHISPEVLTDTGP